MASAGVDAFSFHWQIEAAPCFTPPPPWTLLPAVLAKLPADVVRGMMVVPEFWWPQFLAMRVKFRVFTDPVHIFPDGSLRPKPRWNTVLAILDGLLFVKKNTPPVQVVGALFW